MNIELRNALRDAGLSQSGFARTLVAWGDPRPPDVVLRWVQRAIAGTETSPHISMVIRLLNEHIERRISLRRTLRLLENGGMRSGQNTGAGWENTTAQSIAEFKRQIGELDKLLAECRLGDATHTLSLEDVDSVTLSRFQSIYAVLPGGDSAYLVWNSRRLVPFVSRDRSGTLIEDAMVQVASLEPADLDPLYDRLSKAGGERGIVRAVGKSA